MLTSDQSLVDLSYMVRWNIRNLKQYAYQLKDPQATVREVAEAAMRSSVAEVPLNGVMGGSGRAEIEANVRSRMQAVLDAYRAGILIQGVDIKKADPPAKVNAAFQKVQAAQQNYTELSNAQAYAQQVKALAEGSATQFNKVYEQYRRPRGDPAPHVLRNDGTGAAQQRQGDRPTGGVTGYLPLPAMQKKAIVPDAPQQPGSGQ
jgi:membrane protease subunit HflK